MKSITRYNFIVIYTLIGCLVLLGMLGVPFAVSTEAAINQQINYQGKLANSAGETVADGNYQIVFNLYTVSSGGSPIWTEVWSGANEIEVNSGLFSVMLGASSTLANVNFNQTLYLGVTIESDSEMTPRKVLGSVPAAFEADRIDGLDSTRFLRNDTTNATSTTNTAFILTQNGTGDIVNFFDGSTEVFTILDGGNVGIGTTTPGFKLSVGSGDLLVDGFIKASYFVSTSTATSTFAGGVQTAALDVTGSATSTFAQGINLASGCFAVNGVCVGGAGGGSGTVSSGTQGQVAFYNANGTTVSGTSTLTLASNSTVGIGTTTPWGLLSLHATSGGSNPLFTIASSTSGAATTTVFHIDSFGRVGVATTTPSATFAVNGTSYVSATSTTGSIITSRYAQNNETGARYATLPELALTRSWNRFTQVNPLGGATTTFHMPTNYYLATSTLNFNPSAYFTDVSGIAYYPRNNSIMLIRNTDNGEAIHEYTLDGTPLRTFDLGTANDWYDTEAIHWMYDDWFVIGEERGQGVTWIQIPTNTTAATTTLTKANGITISTASSIITGGDLNQTIEGVAYNPDQDVFYVVKEGNGTGTMGVYQMTRNGTISVLFSTTTFQTNGIGDLSDVYFDRNTQHLFFTVDQCNGQANGFSSTLCDGLVEVTLEGQILDKIAAPAGFGQVEGISFSPDGMNMFLVGESNDMYAWYKYQERSPLQFYARATTTPWNLALSTTTPWGSFAIGASTTTQPVFNIGSSTTTYLNVDAFGRTGLGTTSPFAKLSIQGDTPASGAAPLAIAAYGGAGGASSAGGGFLFQGGIGGSGSGAGGSFSVTTGTAASGGTGAGGAISLATGSGGSGGSAGGAISLVVGTSGGNAAGAAVTITAGGAGTVGGAATGGSVNITAGTGGASGGTGGTVYIAGGAPLTGNTGYGNVVLGATSGGGYFGNVGVATSTPIASLSIKGTSTTRAFLVASSTNTELFNIEANGNVGIGTTTPAFKLSVGSGDLLVDGFVKSSYFVGTSTATSTLGGGLQTTALNITGSATSTFAQGINISVGCFAVNGVCVGGGGAALSGGSPNTFAFWSSETTLGATSSPTVGTIVATSTNATSTISGGVSIGQGFRLSGFDCTAFGQGGTLTTDASGYVVCANDDTGAGSSQWSDAGSDIYFNTGNVGIGSSTPGYRLSVSGTTSVQGLVVGTPTSLPNAIVNIATSVDSYLQVAVQNKSAGNNASTDFVATNDQGSDSRYYVDLGINSSTYNNPSYTITGANDAYLYNSDAALAIGTASTTNTNAVIKFHTGGTLTSNERMRIDTSGNVSIGTTTASERFQVEGGNVLIGKRADSAGTWSAQTRTIGTIAEGGTSAIASTSATAVFNGSLYVGTSKSNSAEVYRYNGSGSWTKVSQATAGTIAEDGGATASIDGVTAMVVYNGALYIGTTETDKAEVYKYDGNSTWTKVSSTTAGSIGGATTTLAIDGISAMAVHGGQLYVGTSESSRAEVYRYDSLLTQTGTYYSKDGWTKMGYTAGTIGADTAVNSINSIMSYNGDLYVTTSKSNAGSVYQYRGYAGAISSPFIRMNGTAGTYLNESTTTSIASIDNARKMAVYNGQMYLGIDDGVNTARILRLNTSNASTTASWQVISSSTAGTIFSGTSTAQNIDQITAMSIYKDDLYVGVMEGGLASVYRLGDGIAWELISNPSYGYIGSTASTTVSGIGVMQVYNDDLYVGTADPDGAEIFKYNIAEGESYALKFQAASDDADPEQNGLKNTGNIMFIAEESAWSVNGNTQTGKFVFSHGINTAIGAYDVAEDYPTRDDSLKPGDVVSIDSSEKVMVKKSKGKNDQNIIGIFSSEPALRLSQKDTHIDGARAVPIALAGRVPVNVTLENGEIEIGDYLVASNEAGKAAKATKPGRVIGRALSAYKGLDGEDAKVIVFIGVETITWNDIAQAAETTEELTDTEADTTIDSAAEFVAAVNEAVADVAYAVINKADNLALVITNKLTAVAAQIKDLFVSKITITPGGSIILPRGTNQIAGSGVIEVGDNEIFIKNNQIDDFSLISLTPTSPVASPLYVAEKRSGEGFLVRMDKEAEVKVTFDWFSIKSYEFEEQTTVIDEDKEQVSSEENDVDVVDDINIEDVDTNSVEDNSNESTEQTEENNDYSLDEPAEQSDSETDTNSETTIENQSEESNESNDNGENADNSGNGGNSESGGDGESSDDEGGSSNSGSDSGDSDGGNSGGGDSGGSSDNGGGDGGGSSE